MPDNRDLDDLAGDILAALTRAKTAGWSITVLDTPSDDIPSDELPVVEVFPDSEDENFASSAISPQTTGAVMIVVKTTASNGWRARVKPHADAARAVLLQDAALCEAWGLPEQLSRTYRASGEGHAFAGCLIRVTYRYTTLIEAPPRPDINRVDGLGEFAGHELGFTIIREEG